MSTAPAFVVNGGNVEATTPAQDLPGFPSGTKLLLVSANERELVFRREQPMYRGMTVDEYMAAWRGMRGVMQDGKNTTEERMREREDEKERDRLRYGD